MARLTIEQVAAPDLTQASEILARAGVSFNDGMNAAKDLLGKYQEGQMAKADAAILNDIAKLDSEEALNAYLNSDALVGKRFSPKMTETILGLRDGVLGYAQDRATTTSTIDSNNRANAAEGRQASEYAYGVKARDEANALTPLVIAANEEGRRYGVNGPSGSSSGISADNPVFTEFMGAVQAGGVTNPYALAAIAATGSHESGFSAKNAAGSWSDPSESGRPGTAGGIMSWNNDRYERMIEFTGGDASGAAQAAYFLQEDPKLIAALNNAQSADEAIRLMNSAWRFAGYDRPGGEAAARAATAAELVPMFGGSQPITSNPGSGPAAAALAEAIKGSLYMSPDQALKLLQTGYDAQTTGQSLIDTAEAKRVQTLSDEATVAAITDPGNLTAGAVARDLIDTPGLSAGARLAIAGQNLDAYGNVIAPSVAPQSNVDAALARAAETDASNAMVDPQAQAFAMVDTFTKSENIGDTLLSTAGLTGDALKESGLDSKYVGQKVKEIANKAGVTEAQAAAALAQIDAEGTPLKEIITGNSGLMEKIIPQISRTYGPEAQDEFRRKQAEQDARTAEREAAKLELDATRSALVKMPDGPQKEAAQARIQVLTETILGGTTPQQLQTKLEDYVVKTGMASRLQGLDPGSAEFFRAMSQLEEAIKTDSTLSETEKGLLIQALRG